MAGLPGPEPPRHIAPWPTGVQLPQDAAQDLAVIAPWLAAAAVGGQQRLHTGEGLIGELEHRLLLGSWMFRSATLSTRTAISSKVRLQY